MEDSFKGIPVSPGVTIGRVFVLDDVRTRIARRVVAQSAVAREAQRLCAPGSCAPGDPLERLARDAPFAALLGHDRDTLRSILAGALLGLG